jgi:hypothetical protein
VRLWTVSPSHCPPRTNEQIEKRKLEVEGTKKPSFQFATINVPFIVRKRQARRRPRALACFSSIVIYFFVWHVCSQMLSRMTAVKDTP